MRKNGVNRKIRPIEGGICAVAGFSASAISCGVRTDGGFDFALVAAEKRCAAAYLPLSRENPALCAANRRYLKNGYAQALFLQSGKANIFQENGEKYTENFSREVDRVTRFLKVETLYFSCGEIAEKFPIDAYLGRIKELVGGLGHSEEHSERVTRTLLRENGVAKQFAFSYDIGDFPCRMGGICKGGSDGRLVLLTTDAKISPQMLQRALETEVRETIDCLALGYSPTPNDCVCILASGNAENCLIDCTDSEYKKFAFALRAVLTEASKILADDAKGKGGFQCAVTGAKSKQAARQFAKLLAVSDGMRTVNLYGNVDLDGWIYTLVSVDESLDIRGLRITVHGDEESVTVFDCGKKMPYRQESLQRLFSAAELKIEVELGAGNYAATAFGRRLT